jgi:hypothetical protein
LLQAQGGKDGGSVHLNSFWFTCWQSSGGTSAEC